MFNTLILEFGSIENTNIFTSTFALIQSKKNFFSSAYNNGVDIDIHVMQKAYRKKLEKCLEIAEGNLF